MGNVIQHVGRWIGVLWRERPRVVNNPIITRELVTQLRKKLSFMYLFLFLAFSSYVFVDGWKTFISSRYIFLSDNFARQLMVSLSMTQGIILLLITPFLSATAVNLERERDTWDMLLTSPMGVASILFGKWLSSFVFIGFIFISIIPIVSLTMPMGGVSPTELILIALATLESIAIAATIGLYCSIRWKRAVHSISFTYLIGAIYFCAVPIIPTAISNKAGWWLLFSPISLLIYALNPQNVTNIFNWPPLKYGLFIHFFCAASVMALFLFLSALQFTPRSKSRVGVWFNRLVVQLGGLAGKPWILIAALWIVVGIALSTYIVDFQYFHFTHKRFFSLERYTMHVLFLFFPLSTTVFYYREWEKKPWDDVGSTPTKLERTLYRFIWHPLALYGKWALGIFPLYLFSFFVLPETIQPGLWFLLFGAETVLYIALFGLACSLMTRSAFLSVLYCYTISAFYFFVFPATIGLAIRGSLSPIDIAFSPTVTPQLSQPFSRLMKMQQVVITDSAEFGDWALHVGLTVVLFVLVLLFCQKRLLTIATRFERESFATWIKRNLFDRKPKVSNVPPNAVIPYFPDGRNPIAVREMRECLLYKRSKTVKTLIWLFLASAAYFWLFPSAHSFREFKSLSVFVLFISPFFIVPFAAGSFRRERDCGTWDLFSTTTMSNWEIMKGKLLAGLGLFNIRFGVFLIPFVVISLLAWTFGGKANANILGLLLLLFLIGCPFFLFVSIFSMFASARAKKTAGAYILSLGAPYLFFILLENFFSVIFPMNFDIRAWISPFFLLQNFYMDQYLIDRGFVLHNHACFQQIITYLALSGLFYVLTYYQLEKKE